MALGVPYEVAGGMTFEQERLVEQGVPWQAAVDLPPGAAAAVARGYADARAEVPERPQDGGAGGGRG